MKKTGPQPSLKLANTYAVIMAGGVGERFWPLSRKSNPKQFLDVFTGESMLQTTVKRVSPSIPPSRIVLVTNKDYEAKSKKALNNQKGVRIIGEPVGKNTAPAIAAAAALIEKENPNAIMVVLSADHIITPVDEFLNSISLAVDIAEKEKKLVCLGVKPLHPHTGLGYIETGEQVAISGKSKAMRVVRFVEKPDALTAKSYVDSGKYLWNCGIFVWSVDIILKSFEEHMPELFKLLSPIRKARTGKILKKAMDTFFKKVVKESIDYGVLEKSKDISVVESPVSWSDVGSWSAFKDLVPADENNNVLKGNCIDIGSKDCFILSDNGIVASYGLDGVYAIRHKDSLLLIHKDKVADIKKLIEKIKDTGDSAKYLM